MKVTVSFEFESTEEATAFIGSVDNVKEPSVVSATPTKKKGGSSRKAATAFIPEVIEKEPVVETPPAPPAPTAQAAAPAPTVQAAAPQVGAPVGKDHPAIKDIQARHASAQASGLDIGVLGELIPNTFKSMGLSPTESKLSLLDINQINTFHFNYVNALNAAMNNGSQAQSFV